MSAWREPWAIVGRYRWREEIGYADLWTILDAWLENRGLRKKINGQRMARLRVEYVDTKGEHGGIHEAAIGLGNFAGPAAGAVSLHFLPQYANSGTLAVTGLLLLGLGGLLVIWRRGNDMPIRASV